MKFFLFVFIFMLLCFCSYFGIFSCCCFFRFYFCCFFCDFCVFPQKIAIFIMNSDHLSRALYRCTNIIASHLTISVSGTKLAPTFPHLYKHKNIYWHIYIDIYIKWGSVKSSGLCWQDILKEHLGHQQKVEDLMSLKNNNIT